MKFGMFVLIGSIGISIVFEGWGKSTFKRGVNRVENDERRHTIFHDDGIFSTNNLDRFMLFSTEMEPTI